MALKNIKCCQTKNTCSIWLIFKYVNVEVYVMIDYKVMGVASLLGSLPHLSKWVFYTVKHPFHEQLCHPLYLSTLPKTEVYLNLEFYFTMGMEFEYNHRFL